MYHVQIIPILEAPQFQLFSLEMEANMNLWINKNHEKYSFKIPVKVILDDYDFPPLIGRAVFFDKFDVTFKQSEKRIILKYKNT